MRVAENPWHGRIDQHDHQAGHRAERTPPDQVEHRKGHAEQNGDRQPHGHQVGLGVLEDADRQARQDLLNAGVLGVILLPAPIFLDRVVVERPLAPDRGHQPVGGVLRGLIVISFIPAVTDARLRIDHRRVSGDKNQNRHEPPDQPHPQRRTTDRDRPGRQRSGGDAVAGCSPARGLTLGHGRLGLANDFERLGRRLGPGLGKQMPFFRRTIFIEPCDIELLAASGLSLCLGLGPSRRGIVGRSLWPGGLKLDLLALGGTLGLFIFLIAHGN